MILLLKLLVIFFGGKGFHILVFLLDTLSFLLRIFDSDSIGTFESSRGIKDGFEKVFEKAGNSKAGFVRGRRRRSTGTGIGKLDGLAVGRESGINSGSKIWTAINSLEGKTTIDGGNILTRVRINTGNFDGGVR